MQACLEARASEHQAARDRISPCKLQQYSLGLDLQPARPKGMDHHTQKHSLSDSTSDFFPLDLNQRRGDIEGRGKGGRGGRDTWRWGDETMMACPHLGKH